jgi:hypothetical protein
VTVIGAFNIPAVVAAKAATRTIPIVFVTGSDPVALGFVASLRRPGGNLTGVTTLSVEIGPKRLETLHELAPAATDIAVLVNPTNPNYAESQRRRSKRRHAVSDCESIFCAPQPQARSMRPGMPVSIPLRRREASLRLFPTDRSALATGETSSRSCSLDHCPMRAPSFQYKSLTASPSLWSRRPRSRRTVLNSALLRRGYLD